MMQLNLTALNYFRYFSLGLGCGIVAFAS